MSEKRTSLLKHSGFSHDEFSHVSHINKIPSTKTKKVGLILKFSFLKEDKGFP